MGLLKEVNHHRKNMGLQPLKESELSKGTKHEKEHDKTYDKIKKYFDEHEKLPPEGDVYKWIAQDHIDDITDYYTRHEKMEKEGGSDDEDD